jgi:hypothetical protein
LPRLPTLPTLIDRGNSTLECGLGLLNVGNLGTVGNVGNVPGFTL